MTERSARERRIATREIAEVWFVDHLGRISALVLAVAAMIALIFLAVIGYTPAIGGVVVIAVGIAILSLGGRMHGGH